MNRTTLILSLMLLTTACGGYDFSTDDSMSNDCYVEGIHSAHSEKKISCRNLSVNVGLARDLMISRGWVKDEAEFNSLYGKVKISIEDKRCIVGPSIGLIPLPGCLYGQYVPNQENPSYFNPRVITDLPVATVYLNWDAGALAHELMHHYDFTHGRADVSSEHKDWKPLGYYAEADDFARSRMPLND